VPEIAEVELVRRSLERFVGQELVGLDVRDRRLDLNCSELVGQPVLQIVRHGKLLGLTFPRNRILAVHLRMTGALLLGTHAKARAVLQFGDTGTVSFVDPRRFGTLMLIDKAEFAAHMAPDLFDVRHLDPQEIMLRLARSRRPLKAVLLDQNLVTAGIGNYMADELLFALGRLPTTPAFALDAHAWERLLDRARQLARTAIRAGGVAVSDYVHLDGSRGTMQERLRCYGRTGLPCVTCGAPLAKTTVAGRGTTFCQICQTS
jgi:formamidopyrimidine-DNA glycosylase